MPRKKIPEHVAIIMDGNGRWAQSRRMPRIRGHLEGVKRVEEIIREAGALGVKVLTLYAFSTENWQRPQREVTGLMRVFRSVLDQKTKSMVKNNLRLRFMGERDHVPANVLARMDEAVSRTQGNTGLIVNIAFNYGSRHEIVNAARRIADAVQQQHLSLAAVDEAVFSRMLYAPDLPDPDLLIRTSGEKRVSNFLLWQISYSELYFTDKCWPEFDQKEFHKALETYHDRERRYGGLFSRDKNKRDRASRI